MVKIKELVPDKSFWDTTSMDYMNTVKARVSEESAARKERRERKERERKEQERKEREKAEAARGRNEDD